MLLRRSARGLYRARAAVTFDWTLVISPPSCAPAYTWICKLYTSKEIRLQQVGPLAGCPGKTALLLEGEKEKLYFLFSDLTDIYYKLNHIL